MARSVRFNDEWSEPEMNSLYRQPCQTDLIAHALARWPDRDAFVAGDVRWSYAAAAERISRLAAALHAAGVGPDRGVAVLAGNQVNAWLAMTAASFLGARVTPLPSISSPDADAFIADDAAIDTLVVDADLFGDRASALQAGAGPLRQVFALGPGGDFPDLLALADKEPASDLRHSPALEPDRIARVQYTGGTTGRPKGVVLSHGAVTASVNILNAEGAVPRDARYLAAAPITHAASLFILPTLLRGGTVVLHPRFDPDAYLRAITDQHITFTMAVPTMVYMLLDRLAARPADVSSLQTLFYGAAPMSPERLPEALERFGPVFMQGYGQTESAGMGTILAREDHDVANATAIGSVGRPAAMMHLQIQDESGAAVAPGEPGEICLSGPSIMTGYWQRPELTRETLRGGWLHTGDVGVEHDGFVTIVDRLKDMIISGGFNVYPREVELALETHPDVVAAAVVGQPDDKWGQSVRAVVVLRPQASVSADALREFVKQAKGAVAAPKEFTFVDSLPVTAVGKLDKPAVRARYNV